MTSQTMFDRIWDQHVVDDLGNGVFLLHVDRHLMHELDRRIAAARAALGSRLMGEALLFCREHYPGSPVALTAQVYLAPFYRGFGFEPTGELFDDFGVTHVDMELRPRG